MTPRERVQAALQHRQPDRTPVFEYVLLSPLADVFLGRRYAGDPKNWPALVEEKGWGPAVRRSAADRVELALRLGHDMLYATPAALPPVAADEADGERPAPPVDDPVAAVKMRNEAAAQAQPCDDGLLIYSFLKDQMRSRGIDLPILAPAYLHGVWTDADLMQTMLLDPPVARRHFAIATQRALALIEKYIALGIDQIGIGGDFSGTRPIISPQAYRAFIVPEVRKLSRRIHEANLYAVNASDGNLWPVIEDFLFGCEVDGYLEIDLHAGMDLRKLKAAFGDRITFYGNLDCGNVLSFASPRDARRHTIECLEAGMGSGGHILCTSNAIAPGIPLANYLAVVNAYRDMFGMPGLEVRA